MAAFILARFGPALKDFFSSLGELSLKGGDFEATVKRKQAEAAAALVAASVARPDASATPESAARNAGEAAAVVAESVNDQVIRRASKATALMGRPPDARAGYTLLDQLRGSGNKTPLVFYAGSNAPEHKAEARSHGAIGSTNRASELFGYVLTALNRDG